MHKDINSDAKHANTRHADRPLFPKWEYACGMPEFTENFLDMSDT
jgi:hypothetical protein